MAVTTTLQVPAAHAVRFEPELELETRYDDNVAHAPAGRDDLVSVISPQLAFRSQDPISLWELRARSSFTAYRETEPSSTRTDLVSGLLEYRPGPFSGFEAAGRYQSSDDPIDFEDGVVVTRGDVTAARGRARLELWIGDAAGSYRRWDYAAGELRDGQSGSWSGHLFPYRTRVTRIAAGARGQQLEIGDRIQLTSKAQTLAIRRHHTERFWTEIEGGRLEFEHPQSNFKDIRATYGGAFQYRGGTPGSQLVFGARAADDVATLVDAHFTWGGIGRSATLGYESGVDAEAGVFRVASWSRRGHAAYRDTFPIGLAVELEASAGKVRPLRGAGPDFDQYRGSAEIAVPIGFWAWTRLGYDYLRQEVPLGGSGDDFDRNRVKLAFEARLP